MRHRFRWVDLDYNAHPWFRGQARKGKALVVLSVAGGSLGSGRESTHCCAHGMGGAQNQEEPCWQGVKAILK